MEPPNILNLQLLRYIYDMETWTKKKLKSKIKLSKTIFVPRKDNDGNSMEPEEVRECEERRDIQRRHGPPPSRLAAPTPPPFLTP